MIKVLMIIMSCSNGVCVPAITVYDTPADVCLQIKRDLAGTKVYCIPQGQQT